MIRCADVRGDQILLVVDTAVKAEHPDILLAELQTFLRACELPGVGEVCLRRVVAVLRYVMCLYWESETLVRMLMFRSLLKIHMQRLMEEEDK